MKNNSKKDRFQNYDGEVRELVLDFEEMVRMGDRRYFDITQMEIVIDFYLDNLDNVMLEQAVVYAESLFPEAGSIRLRRSHLLCTKERYDEAYEILLELERAEPDNTDVLYALGAIYSVKEQPRKAIQYYQKASADGYELGMVYGNIADEYVRLDRYGDAVSYYKKALAANPEEERSIYNLASCYEQEMLDGQSVSYFTQFVTQSPYSKAAWFCLGCAYRDQSLYERAIDAFEYAIAIDNKFVDCYTVKAECYRAVGNIAQAVASLREALPHAEAPAEINYQIGLLYMDQANYVTAVTYFKSAIGDDASLGDPWMCVAECYAKLNECQIAIDYIGQALKINSHEPAYLFSAANIHHHFGDEETADAYYRQTLDMVDDNDLYWTTYADFLIGCQRYDEAIDLLQRGLPVCNDAFCFNERLAVCYFVTGRRNFLFNALRSCVSENKDLAREVLYVCPAMAEDLEVMNILNSD